MYLKIRCFSPGDVSYFGNRRLKRVRSGGVNVITKRTGWIGYLLAFCNILYTEVEVYAMNYREEKNRLCVLS